MGDRETEPEVPPRAGRPPEGQIQNEVARVFREEYGRVLAPIVRLLGDLGRAEDVVQEAFSRAAEHWAEDGLPDKPGAWVTTVARRLALDALRRDRARSRAEVRGSAPDVSDEADEPEEEDGSELFPDERLRLVFTCCHPALPEVARIALTLRTLGGLTTPEIARALLSAEATVAQRIVRAKQKIRETNIPYAIPTEADLPERLETVLTVVYLVFNEGYSSPERAELCTHALRLGEMLVDLLPAEPEVLGLYALMQLHDARRAARFGAEGEFIPLEEQDRWRWDRPRIDAAATLLDRAVAMRRRGPYQIQAAIAALHGTAATEAETDWRQIVLLYDTLLTIASSPVVALNRAAAIAMADGPDAGLRLLEPLSRDPALADYALVAAARADLLRRAGRFADARPAYREAIAAARSDRDRAYLERRLRELPS